MAVAGASLVLVATARYGPGVSPDSVLYASTAESLRLGQGYVQFDGQPLVAYAPLFPSLLALGGPDLADRLTTARWLNAAAFGLIVGLASHWNLGHARVPALGVLGSVAIVLCMPVFRASAYAWSEPLYILCALACLVQLEGWLAGGKPSRLWLAAILAGLAWLARYVGVAVVLTGLASIASCRQRSWRARLTQASGFVVVCALPMGAWLAHNYLVSGTLTGQDRFPSDVTLLESAREAAVDMSIWLAPDAVPERLRLALLGLALGAMLAALFRRWRSDAGACLSQDLPRIRPFPLYVVIYASVMVLSTATLAVDPLRARLLAPVYVPLIMTAAVLLSSLASGRASGTWLAIAVACWLVYPAVLLAGAIRTYVVNGAGGFHTSRWMDSELARYARSHEFAHVLYADEPFALYLLTGKVAHQSPRRYFYRTHIPAPDLETLDAELQTNGRADVIWFDGQWGEFLYDPHDLAQRYSLTELESAQDGAAYSITGH